MKKIVTPNITAENHKKTGLQKMNSGDLIAAINNFSKALKIEHDNPEIYRLRGKAKCYTGKYSSAISDYSKALEMDPLNANIYFDRGVAHYYTYHDYSSAIADINKSIEICLPHYSAYYILGITSYSQRDYKTAILNFTKYIEMCPDFNRFINEQEKNTKFTSSSNNEHEWDQYYLDYINPSAADIYNHIGFSYLILGNKSDALNAFNKAIAIDPEDINSYDMRADIKYSLNDYAGAFEDSNKAIELECFDWKALLIRANIMFRFKKFNEAMLDYDLGIEYAEECCDFNTLIELYSNRGKTKYVLCDLLGAYTDFEKALEMGHELGVDDKDVLDQIEKVEIELIKFLES